MEPILLPCPVFKTHCFQFDFAKSAKSFTVSPGSPFWPAGPRDPGMPSFPGLPGQPKNPGQPQVG